MLMPMAAYASAYTYVHGCVRTYAYAHRCVSNQRGRMLIAACESAQSYAHRCVRIARFSDFYDPAWSDCSNRVLVTQRVYFYRPNVSPGHCY